MFPVFLPVSIDYRIPLDQVRIEIDGLKYQHENQLVEGVQDVLKFIEQDQIKAYTSTGNPPLPPGSRYQRTFTLQGASETEITGRKLPDISGVWRVNESKARYGPFVLGSRAEQAPIHRNRWKARTQIEQEAREAAPAIIERRLQQ